MYLQSDGVRDKRRGLRRWIELDSVGIGMDCVDLVLDIKAEDISDFAEESYG